MISIHGRSGTTIDWSTGKHAVLVWGTDAINPIQVALEVPPADPLTAAASPQLN